MKIDEANIYQFGKLKEHSYLFGPGINLVCGRNESGKSTLHSFLTAMLFGMEKGRGKAGMAYARYEPWHAPSYYAGALRFTVAGRPFYLERNFYHKEKKEILRNEADGEELSVAYGDLAMLLGGIGKEAFANTFDISQAGARTGKELQELLAEYLSNASSGGTEKTHVAAALKILEVKRKTLNLDLRKEKERVQQECRSLQIEKELLEQDCGKLKKDIEAGEYEMHALNQRQSEAKLAEAKVRELYKHCNPERYGQEKQKQPACRVESGAAQRKHKFLTPVFSVIMFAAACFNIMIHAVYPYNNIVFYIMQGLLIVSGAAFLISYFRKRQQRLQQNGQTASNEPEDRDRMEADLSVLRRNADYAGAAMAQTEKLLGGLKDSLRDKETRLYNISEQLEQINRSEASSFCSREHELKQDISALELAESEIRRLAGEYCDDMKDTLNGEVSRLVSSITAGAYDSVKVTARGSLIVLAEGKEVPPEALSRGTMEQIYLALRLAVGNIMSGEEPMPLLLDEAAVMYDDLRLQQVLRLLAETGNQVFLFTCQNREENLLRQLGITYHRICLD